MADSPIDCQCTFHTSPEPSGYRPVYGGSATIKKTVLFTCLASPVFWRCCEQLGDFHQHCLTHGHPNYWDSCRSSFHLLVSPQCFFCPARYHWLLWILLSCSLILIIKGFRDFRFATILLIRPVVKEASPVPALIETSGDFHPLDKYPRFPLLLFRKICILRTVLMTEGNNLFRAS